MKKKVFIQSTGAVCAVGMGTQQVAASVRARISRTRQSSFAGPSSVPLVAAWLPDDALPNLPPEMEQTALTQRQLRMMQIALPAIGEALGEHKGPCPLFLGLPDEHPNVPANLYTPEQWLKAFIYLLEPNIIDAAASEAFPIGRSSGIVALDAAVNYLAQNRGQTALVGAVDTFWDVPLLTQLAKEERLLVEGVADGFIPGEGAAFFLLSTAHPPNEGPATVVDSTGVAMEPGHRYSDAPMKGEGLPNAIEQLRAKLDAIRPANLVYAGYNGEHFDAKSWGTAALRHKDLFADEYMFEHPADVFGDLGAALSAMFVVLAHVAMTAGYREAPALVWAGSDLGTHACAWLDLQGAVT